MSNKKGKPEDKEENSDEEQPVYSKKPIQFAIRSEQGVQIVQAEPPLSNLAKVLSSGAEDNEFLEARELEGDVQYSSDGRLVAVIGEEAVRVFEAEGLKLLHSLKRTGVDKIEFSPLGSFLVTWESKMRSGEPNLYIWDLKNGLVAKTLHQKETKERGQWPPFSWTSDEKLFAHLVSNQVNIYDGKSVSKDIIAKLRYPDICQFSISPGSDSYLIAVARLPKSSQPGRVSIYQYPNFNDDEVICSKGFFKADEIILKWSPKANPAAVLIETNTITSDNSYYGDTNLYLLHANGKFDCAVPFGADSGPIQDAQWSPKGREFAVIQGKQPAQSILFRVDDCKPTHHFGRSAQNTIRWSPHGRFLMLGGFGNCPGNMTFWDRNKKKIMGTVQDRDSPRSFEWTADGRAFITAAFRPYRTVANGFKVYTYYGTLLHHQKFDKLFQVVTRPALEGVFPDRPQSPHLTDKRFKQENEKRLDAGKSKAYVPPSLRARGTGPSNIMKKDDDGPRTLSELEKSILPGSGVAKYVPGQGMTKPTSAKAAKRRKNKAKKDVEAKKAEEKKAEEAKEKKKAPTSPTVDLTDPDAVSKRVKALKKKLRQVEQLQEQVKSGKELDPAQKEKLDQAKGLNEEIAMLEETLK